MHLRHLACVLLVLPLTGCLTSTTLITVDRAGRGTIEQTLLTSPKTPPLTLPGLGGAPPSESDFTAMAAALGPGVRFVSQRPAQAGGFTGSIATFAFDDIRTVRLRPDPTAPPESAPLAFTLVPQGDGQLLTVTMVETKAAMLAAAPATTPPLFGTPSARAMPPDAPAFGPNLADPNVAQMVKGMVEGFRVSVALQLQGTITGTSAAKVSGSRVTLVDVDAATLIANPEAPTRLQGALRPGISLTELRPQLKGLKGIVLEGPSVTVAFK
ncbi:MAG: hypothetical protein FJW29_03860 [Acidobacteria bacterium]|nr:hypothetical protein [Acidobacteriota bacterium]